MSTKELGTITDIFVGKEDHGIPTVSVTIEFGGCTQGFGNLCLPKETQETYLEMLCDIFGVSDYNYKKLIGKKCYALRCFDSWNESIEGVESLDGARFTHTDFRHKLHNTKETVLAARKTYLQDDISRLSELVNRKKKELKTLDHSYVAWSYMEQRKRKPQASKKRR